MTTASFNYIAAQYEGAVDMGLDVQAIRLRLAEHGIRRTPAQVLHDLDYVYAFTGYADSHQPLPALTMAESDTIIDNMTPKEVRLSAMAETAMQQLRTFHAAPATLM